LGWCGWPPTGTWSVAGRRPTAGGASADRHATRQRARELVESLTGRELEPGAVAAQQLPGPADRLAHAYGENALANEACSSWATTTPAASGQLLELSGVGWTRRANFITAGLVTFIFAVACSGRCSHLAARPGERCCRCPRDRAVRRRHLRHRPRGRPPIRDPRLAPALRQRRRRLARPALGSGWEMAVGHGYGADGRPGVVEGRHGLFGRWGVEYGDEQPHPSTVPSCRAVGVTSRWMTRRQCRRPLNVTGKVACARAQVWSVMSVLRVGKLRSVHLCRPSSGRRRGSPQ
jgi:hypothetical protein